MTPNIAHGTHYLRLVNNVQLTAQYDLIATGQGGSEGAIGDPILLTSRTPYAGHAVSGETSYYAFQTEALSSAAPYLAAITGLTPYDWITWTIYSDSAFSTPLVQCNSTTFNDDVVCATNETSQILLDPGSLYYLAVQNGSSSSAYAYTVNVTPYAASVGCSAGGTCYNFESGTLSPFISSSPAWTVSSLNSAGTGTNNIQSGISVKNQTSSCFHISATDVSWVSFSFNTQFANTDSFDLYVDSSSVKAWSGTNPWQRVVYRPSSSGAHTFEWCHNKPSTSYIENKVWVDDVEFNY